MGKIKNVMLVLFISLIISLLIILILPVLVDTTEAVPNVKVKDWLDFLWEVMPMIKMVLYFAFLILFSIFILHKVSHVATSIDSVIDCVNNISNSYRNIFFGNQPKNLRFLTNEGLELTGKLNNGVYTMWYKDSVTNQAMPICNLENTLVSLGNQSEIVNSITYIELVTEFTSHIC
jgi:hypothetical protein